MTDSTESPFWRRPISRRLLLVAGGSGLLAATLPPGSALPTLLAADATPSLTLDLLRPQDMLKLRYEFFNLQVVNGLLVAVDPAVQSLIAVNFDSQHVMEQTTFVSNWGETSQQPGTMPTPGTVHAQAVAGSRLVFLVPSTVKQLPYTEEGLLNWTSWVMQVVPATLQAPPQHTDLLLVDWLHLTPEASSSWVHLATPLTSQGRTELWHTRLALRDGLGHPDATLGSAPIRAIAADPVPSDTPFKALIGYPYDTKVPAQLVDQSNQIEPVKADLLLLSAQGSSVELAADWGGSAPIAQWRQRSSIGRDNYVRVEQRGFLFPYGHRATVVTETERFIVEGVAQFLQRAYIRIRQPVNDYEDNSLPFTKVEIAMTTTPNLAPKPEVVSGNTFWVQYATATGVADVPFPMVGTDHAGNRVGFTAFMAFVHIEDAYDSDGLSQLRAKFHNGQYKTDAFTDGRRVHDFGGQHVAYAPPAASTFAAAHDNSSGTTAFPTTAMFMSSGDGDPAGQWRVHEQPNFTPSMLAAQVSLPAVAKLVQQEITATIGYDPQYLVNGIEGVAAQTFARVQTSVEAIGQVLENLPLANGQFPDAEVKATFAAVVSNVGGVTVPDLDIGALSRELGPLSGKARDIEGIIRDGKFNPAKYFSLSAKLLGGISLGDLIGADLPDTPTLPELPSIADGPKIVTTPVYPGNDTSRPPTSVTTTIDWQPKMPTKLALKVFQPSLDNGKAATLTLHGEFHTTVSDAPKTTYSIHGDLRNFTLILVDGTPNSPLGFIALAFRQFTFDVADGAKPKLHVDISDVSFRGPLDFINTLQKYLVSTGDGVSIDVQPSGITAGYTLAIPDVGVGVFALQHMAFTAGLNLPFDGSAARARFAFCSREHPFTLSVSLFGGGGFLALALGTDGFEMLEASIEFGGCVAFNLGVASGSVSVMAGIYFKLEQSGDDDIVTLSGYLRASGQLNVLGLITISAEFYLSLGYTNANHTNTVEGDASLTVEIDILFFHKSVSLHVHKSFSGPSSQRSALAAAGGPPKFGDQLSQDDWNTYCDAFSA